MNISLILIVALLPVALLSFYIYKRDPLPEPAPLLRKAFIYGALIVFPILIVESVFSFALTPLLAIPFIGAILKAFIVAAIPEEGFKLLALWLLLRKNPYFDEHIDGIVYAVYVSLGFAAIENITYLFGNQEIMLQVGIMRALMAVPGHYAFGILMGFFYSLYYFVNRSSYNRNMIFVAPVIAHGTYDAILFVSEMSEYVAVISIIASVVFCIWLHRFCFKRIQSHIHRDKKIFGE